MCHFVDRTAQYSPSSYDFYRKSERDGYSKISYLDIEKNIPSFYSGFLLFFSSFLFFCISLLDKKQRKIRYYWLGLAAVFCFLSLDETFVLHERLGDYAEKYITSTGILEVSGLLYFPWIVPYSILMILLGLLYFRF
ncbi:MAG: hypothetical protein D3908_14195, partial [Candidatus Electrothrix sp. AUS4]|nr:hypothetical protein [Candidatus Electrothrix sp. AUS4]